MYFPELFPALMIGREKIFVSAFPNLNQYKN